MICLSVVLRKRFDHSPESAFAVRIFNQRDYCFWLRSFYRFLGKRTWVIRESIIKLFEKHDFPWNNWIYSNLFRNSNIMLIYANYDLPSDCCFNIGPNIYNLQSINVRLCVCLYVYTRNLQYSSLWDNSYLYLFTIAAVIWFSKWFRNCFIWLPKVKICQIKNWYSRSSKTGQSF